MLSPVNFTEGMIISGSTAKIIFVLNSLYWRIIYFGVTKGNGPLQTTRHKNINIDLVSLNVIPENITS
jgi:hypothetical protein